MVAMQQAKLVYVCVCVCVCWRRLVSLALQDSVREPRMLEQAGSMVPQYITWHPGMCVCVGGGKPITKMIAFPRPSTFMPAAPQRQSSYHAKEE